jgi:uncharacterized protein (DUF433 family)
MNPRSVVLSDFISDVQDPFRTGKAYTVREVARLAKTTPATVRRWLKGYDAPGHHMDAVFGEREPQPLGEAMQVSFLELVEIAIAVKFRRGDQNVVSLERIRRAHAYARREWLVPFPFATMRFKAFGGHLLHEFQEEFPGEGQLAFDMNGQWVLPGLVQAEIVTVDFDVADEYAAKWYPYGRDAHVVIDPHYAAGRPTIEGTRIPIHAIKERFEAGDSVGFLAKDYALKTSIVEEILRLPAA